MYPPVQEVDPKASRTAALFASFALLCFSAFTAVVLIGWLAQGDVTWSWKSVLALGSALLAVTTSALVWRAPTRSHALMGIGAMLFSLLRIGAPADWTWRSFELVLVTFVFLVPLVHAAIVLRNEE
jgi:hypothetical protein